ncbi:MAG: DUF4270 family protein [Bacteroidota bacterium]
MGCEEDLGGIGAEVLPEEDLIDFIFTDTSTIIIETIKDDSINTFRPTDLLFGNYADPEFGRITATAYTEFFSRSGLDFGPPEDLILDSIVLAIGIRDSYGRLDLNLIQRLTVHELAEDVPEDEEAVSSRQLKIKGPNLAEGFEFIYDSAGTNRLILAKLNNSLGRKILFADPDSISSNTIFREFFKGIAIGTEEAPFFNREPGAIFSVDILDGTPQIFLYYQRRENGAFSPQDAEPFQVPSSFPRFTSIIRTDTAGKLVDEVINREDLQDQYELMQAGAYIKNFIQFPNIRELGLVAVSRAELVLTVDTTLLGSTGAFVPPAQIEPFLVDENKELILNENGFPIEVELNRLGTAIATYNSREGVYSFDLTGYIQRVISGQQDNNGFLLTPSARNFSVNRVVFGGPEHPTMRAKLNLTYTNLPR